MLNAINSLPTVQISQGIVVLFEKIYDGEQILTVFSVSGKDIHYRCFYSVYYVSWSDIDAVFANNYCILVGFGLASAPVRCAHPSF